ncbi:LysR family transcriptional regulator [Aliidongia dinghuensis]|uniref:LysR family transcriptional regulator n=1 Tax=Aliidongia dinghuensis TaxID=1867774 RepID=A0A8J2Z060_9PROT|nr:LysR substrate-binding domain-containing protein [Aliidongia dinghuensis]GGF45047.1 LysR family transcriptional regulator [Aliidongia dinghuensis]
MELRHLRYFLAVAEELNFSRAAQHLHIAQPPLSQQIRQLEDELGLQLFERGSRPLRLTEAGRFFHTEARQILAKLDAAVDGTRRIARGQTGWLGLGYVGSAMHVLVPPVLRRFHAEHPGVEVLLFEMLTADQAAALLDRRIHVGFVRPAIGHDELVEELLYAEPVGIAVPADHPFASRAGLHIAELAGQPIVLFGGRAARGVESDFILSLFRQGGIEPQAVVEAQSMESCLGLVAAGMGLAVVSSGYGHVPRAGVRFVPLTAAPSIPMKLAYRPQERSPAVLAFLKIVREEVSKTRRISEFPSAEYATHIELSPGPFVGTIPAM